MKNSTDGGENGRFSNPQFSVWDVHEGALSIGLHLSTVEWLDYEITRSLASPEEGIEVGGLLLGRTEVDTRRRIMIEGFTPVACEHLFGPAYHLSSADKRLLQEQMTRWNRGAGRSLHVVGYYRSHQREGVNLDDHDLLLAKEYFSDCESVFLLAQTLNARLIMGGLFVCRHGHVERQPRLMFPFDRTRLARGETTLPYSPAEAVEVKPELPDTPYPQPEVPESQAEPPVLVRESPPDRAPVQTLAFQQLASLPPRRIFFWPGLAIAGILVLALGGIGYKYLMNQAKTQTVADTLTELDLTTAIDDKLLRINWNRRSPLILTATHGILSIVDGTSTTELKLNAEQLRAGGLVYAHESGDVTVRLRVIASHREATESARILRYNRLGSPRPPANEEPAANAAAGSSPPLIATTEAVRTPSAPTVKSPSEAGQASRVRDSQGVRSETAPTSVKDEPVPPSVTEPPLPKSLPSLPNESGVVPSSDSSRKVVETVPQPEESAKSPPQPVTAGVSEKIKDPSPEASPPLSAMHSIASVQGPGLIIDYIAAQAIHRVAPFLPSRLRNLPVAGLRIDVKVYIDANGTVIRAESLSKGNTLTEYLSSIAVDAARQWRFSPARRGAQSVSSETILHFQFGNGTE